MKQNFKPNLEYVIITPVHNEEAFIERTIQSMIDQTIRPIRWIIVNDSSRDRSGEIIKRYESRHNFILLINLKRSPGRHFGHKVNAFHRGLAETNGLDYEYIGNLDADISVHQDYYEKILHEFGRNPKLGLAGGMVSSWIRDRFVCQNVALDSVAGAVQLFRRSCFEQIGGYIALPLGGIDAAAEIMTRMRGWEVRTFPELCAFENRRTGTATDSPLLARVKEGQRMYSLGYGLLFFCLRCGFRSLERPNIIGSAAAIFGYIAALIRRYPKVLPPDVIQYLRSEQRAKLLRRAGLSN